MTHIYLIRHGESEEEIEKRIGDRPLTERGRQQAETLQKRLIITQEIRADVLIASPFQRTLQTAEILAPIWELSIREEPGLQKWMPASAIGLPFDEFKRRYGPNPYQPGADFAVEETWAQYLVRVFSTLDMLLHRYAGKTMVIIAHRGIIECAFAYFYGATNLDFPRVHLASAYTSLTHWEHHPDPFSSGWRLVSHNDVTHLSPQQR